mgnify:FL=1
MISRMSLPQYLQELDSVIRQDISWDCLKGKTLVVSGATGMIGSFLIDLIMRLNSIYELSCHVVALGRKRQKAEKRLPYFDSPDFEFIECDLSNTRELPALNADYILHLASSTHPRAYASDPIGTIEGNVDGLRALLNLADQSGAELLFASSVEVYGENRGDVERFDESYSGYLDCNTLRACYNESKRLGEAMCQAWKSQKGVSVHIARIARVYGPTLLPSDSKALSQFIHKGIAGENVVLKSEGNQLFSYLHVADAVSGILRVLLSGESGQAYNLADESSDVRLRDLAKVVCDSCGVSLEFCLPDANEAAGYSKATLALMDGSKAKNELGWKAVYDIETGINETVDIIRGL